MIMMTIFWFPINFKSEVEETSLLSGRKFFYHVVLGIAYKGGQHGATILVVKLMVTMKMMRMRMKMLQKTILLPRLLGHCL